MAKEITLDIDGDSYVVPVLDDYSDSNLLDNFYVKDADTGAFIGDGPTVGKAIAASKLYKSLEVDASRLQLFVDDLQNERDRVDAAIQDTKEELQTAIDSSASIFSGIISGAVSGGVIGSLIPVVGTSVGILTGGLTSLAAGLISEGFEATDEATALAIKQQFLEFAKNEIDFAVSRIDDVREFTVQHVASTEKTISWSKLKGVEESRENASKSLALASNLISEATPDDELGSLSDILSDSALNFLSNIDPTQATTLYAELTSGNLTLPELRKTLSLDVQRLWEAIEEQQPEPILSPSRLDHFEEIASRLEIKGSNNPDRLVAGDDGDVLVGKAGNDTLVGGAGADTLKGGAGVDTYEIGQPDGRDVIRDDGGTLDLTDINAGAVGFFKDGYDLVVSGSSSNFAAIRGFFDKNLAKSELSAGDYADWSFAFADGTLDSADVIDRMGSDDFPDPPPPDTTDEKTARSVTLVEDTSLPPVAPGDEIHVSELFDFEGGNVNDFDGFYLVDETTADHSGYFVDEDGDRAQRDDDIAIALSPDGYDEMVNGVDNQPFGSPEYEYWADAFSAYDVEWQDAFYRGGEGENDVEIVPFLFDGDKSYGHFEMDLLLSEDRRLEIDIESTREPNDAPSLGASAVSVSSAADGFTAPLTPSDPDGDLLRLDIELTSAPADAQVRWAGEPLSSGRTLTLSEGAADAQVSVAGAVRGDSLTFRVRADDGRATSGWTTFTAEVTNGAPAAGDDSIEVGKDVAKPLPVDRLVANDSDADGDTLSIASRTDPGNGTLSTDADGQLIYTPDAGFTGTDSFTYTVADGHGGTDTATVTLDVDRPQITASAPGARVFGRSGPDVIEGTDGDETLLGGPGADEISGGAGHDTASYLDSEEGVAVGLAGDPGRGGTAEGDVLSGIEALVGSAFDDRLSGDAGANDLEGAGGDDTLAGRGGADDLAGGAGRDAASYAGAASAVVAELWTGGGSAGAADGDTYSSIEDLIGSAHADRLVGDGGDNVLNGGADGDFLSGGPGRDTASYAGAAEGVTAELWTGRGARGEAAGDTYRAIENLTGSDHDDRLVGDGGDNVLTGGAGADWLSGGPGIDTASYADAPGAVDVKLWRNAKLASEGGEPGHASGDVFTSVENVVGSDFDDSLIGDAAANLLIGGAGADRLSGGPGGDTASYAPSTGAVTVELWSGDGQGGTAEGDSLHAIEHLIGSDHDDKLVGDAGDNTLAGGAGADQLTGGPGQDTASYADAATGITAKLWMRAGYTGAAEGDRYRAIENLAGSDHDDRLVGDAGDNVLTGRAGADELLGSSGTDTASYADADGGVTVKLWTGAGTRGEADGDRLSGIENLTGSDHADRLVGDAGANVLDGRGGDDQLLGSVGPDTFVFAPGDGHDTVSGWTDGDRLDVQAFGFAGRADALDKAVAAGDGVRIDLGPESQVTIKGIALEDLEARDFAI